MDDAVDVEEREEIKTNPTKKLKGSSTWQVIWREFKKDKLALACLIFITLLIAGIYIGSMFLKTSQVMRVNILEQYVTPGTDGMILGADQSGRDVFQMLILGARNSLTIGLSITVLIELIGITFGIVSGYFGGRVDNIMMRFLDFMMSLPMLMLIIVIVSIIPHYSMLTFVLVMSAFYWVGTARLVRSKALSESQKDYINASKISGTSNLVIIFRELLPNLSSIIIVDAILNLTANIGIEVGLTFLGFGLPSNIPSLGTLIGFAQDPDILTTKIWVWLPAALLILILCVGISYIGNVVRRAFDARQRLG